MLLKDFRISRFRAFDSLYFERFSIVNLFVGKNNVGKTTVLEALRLYLAEDWQKIAELLVNRDEFAIRSRRKRSGTATYEIAPLSFESLFNGRPNLDRLPSFSVGPSEAPSLSVEFAWLRRIEDEENAAIRYVPEPRGDDLDPDIMPGFILDGKTRQTVPFDRLERSLRRRGIQSVPDVNIVYLPSTGMHPEQLGRIWDSVALTEYEDVVIETLRSISPTLEKLVLVQSPGTRIDRILMAKMTEFSEPVPFKSLGDGVQHLLGLVLALLNARGGVLLADEVENGLHYSIQNSLWRIILRQAREWNVQVFSTTHSWDCIRGLQEACRELPRSNADATLFRIEERQSQFRAVRFSSHELSIAQSEDIEVR